MDRRQSPRRAGFTLVEVLVAILIVALLVAILLPAIQGAYRRAREAQVSAELNNMATALASFKNTYGDYPPSRIILSEEGFTTTIARAEFATPTMIPGADLNDSDITYYQLYQRSVLYLRRFWPRVDFNGTQFDFNNDGVYGSYIILNGSECLSFFLGGLPLNNIDGNVVTTVSSPGFRVTGVSGFSRLPTNPFIGQNYLTLKNATLSATASNRTAPNYDFNAGRLIDQDGDGIPSYIDPLDITPENQRSYAYFCSYGTNSYDPNDVNGLGKAFDHSGTHGDSGDFEQEDASTPTSVILVERGYTVGFPTSGTNAPMAVSPTPNPYTSGTPVTTGSMSWINPNSFQLFSAGHDRYFGLGGQYVQGSTGSGGKLPISPNPTDLGNLHGDQSTGVRYRESDNLTNFSGGRLD